VDFGGLGEGDLPVSGVSVEELLEALEVVFVPGIAGGWGIGGGEEAALQASPIQSVGIVEGGGAGLAAGKEDLSAGIGGVLVAVGEFFVREAERLEQLFVVGEKGRGVGLPLIANEEDPAARAEEPLEFVAGFGGIEPVEGLGDGYGFERGVGEAGLLGGSGDGVEMREDCEVLFGGEAHGFVRFDGGDVEAGFEEEPGEDAGAGSYIGDGSAGVKRDGVADEIDEGGRVAGAVAAVGVGAVGEAVGGVHGGDLRGWGLAFSELLLGHLTGVDS
jgi:hypothetical protein